MSAIRNIVLKAERTHQMVNSRIRPSFQQQTSVPVNITNINNTFRTMSSVAQEQAALVSREEVRSFIIRCMTSIGCKSSHTIDLADVLLAADYRGHFSHGINRLELYIKDISNKVCRSDTEPQILKETVSTAWVEGNNLLGPVVGNFCIDLAIKKAKETGIGWVVAKGSNHFGIAGWYSLRAVEQGLLGMAFTNSSPFTVPTRAKKNIFGTNPLSVAAPANNNDSYVLDMATSSVAVGKIEIQKRKGNSIPPCWAYDQDVKPTTDPSVAMQAAMLMPLGGAEENSGYKGYGLCMMVEVFCGILAGSLYGPQIRSWSSNSSEANLGQCFVALDPKAFAPGFEDRMSDLINMCRSAEPVDPNLPVLVAGDPERHHMALCDANGGIKYHINVINYYNELAKQLGVDPISYKLSSH